MTIGNDPSAPIAVTALIRAGADGSDIQRLDLIWYFLGRAIALQSDGRVVVAGSSKESTTDSNRHVMLQRYDQDGVLDVSFGVNGTVRYGAITEDASAVAIQPDGKILVGGTSSDGSRSHALLLRYDGDGVLDGSFGNGGVVTYDPGTNGSAGVDIALQPDGKILLSGTTAAATRDVLLLRYNPNGSLDQSFGTNGAATYDSGDEDWGFGLALQPDGRIVLVGQHVVSGNGYALLLRYDASGSPDATFGTGGAITSVQGIARDVAVASDGKLVVAGDTFSPGIVFSVALVAKYNPDGTPDTSFGQDGIVAYDATGAVDHANALALLADGSVVAVGAANHTFGLGGGSPGDLLVMKLYDVCQ